MPKTGTSKDEKVSENDTLTLGCCLRKTIPRGESEIPFLCVAGIHFTSSRPSKLLNVAKVANFARDEKEPPNKFHAE